MAGFQVTPEGLFHAVVRDVIGGGFRSKRKMIAYVLLDKSIAVVAADDGVA